MTGPVVRRGEIWWVSFDPAIGGEIRKTRPAVVVSNDRYNAGSNRVQVIPVTTSEKRLYVFEAYVAVRGRECKAMADQIKTVARERIREKIGHVTIEEMKAIETAIRIQLAL